MVEPLQLELFAALVFGIVVLPGVDMSFVLASSLAGGLRGGLAAVAGIVAGGVVHVVIGATGVAAVFAVVPAAFNTLLLFGAIYVAWVGVGLLRGAEGLALGHPVASPSALVTFRQAALTNLLNPKAYVFMFAVFPQFLRPAQGRVAFQALILGTIIWGTQAAVYGVVALAGGRLRRWMEARPARLAVLGRVVGGLLVASALVALVEGWRPLPAPAAVSSLDSSDPWRPETPPPAAPSRR